MQGIHQHQQYNPYNHHQQYNPYINKVQGRKQTHASRERRVPKGPKGVPQFGGHNSCVDLQGRQ